LLIARELPVQRRWIPYSTAGLVIILIALSRLYLGVHWFSDVLAGFSLGLAWVALIGIAYDRHPAPPLPVKRLLIVILLLLTITGTWTTQRYYTQELAHYSPQVELHRITLSTWRTIGWAQLPVYRVDIEGRNEQPMNFQWVGSLESLATKLQQKGWQPTPPLSPLNAMNWLAPEPGITSLPILPQVNNGQHQQLSLVAPHSPEDEHLIVLRLWPSDREILPGHQSVWIGNVVYQYPERELPLISYLRTDANFETPLNHLREALSHIAQIRLMQRIRQPVTTQIQWDGRVLLAWEVPG
jgi:undecaprenyl-diphosphatase